MSTPTAVLAEATDGLALALVTSSTTPLLLLGGDMAVVAASRSFCEDFRIDEASIGGRPLFSLGQGEWDVPQLRSLLKSTLRGGADVPAYEMDLVRTDQNVRRVVIKARKLNFADAGDSRLTVALSDVTAARQAESLHAETLREKDDRLLDGQVLMKQLGGRLANSLQIIASVLLQTAQRVASDETRGRLYNAHSRMLSVAAVQKQLSVHDFAAVHLDTYLNDLCDSLGASMIRDTNQLSLEVKVGDAVTTPEGSVSLGLIVTELVINALRHAFPNHRKGKITIGYRSKGEGWTLSVADNGIGIPEGALAPEAGLGSSLIHALANQLKARVEVKDASPGTLVSIIHP